MKCMLSLLALGYVALANPIPSLPVHPGGIGGLFKGPNSETIIKGPDGSIITSAAEGGAIVSKLGPIVVAEPTVVAAASVEAVAVPAAVVETDQSSDLIGPSGRISTHGAQSVVAGPASTTVTGPAIVAETVVKGPPIIAAPIVSVTPGPLATLSAVTASPVSIVTPVSADLARTALISAPAPAVATVAATPPVIITATAPQATATASTSPLFSVASATSTGALASASVTPNGVTAVADAAGKISTVTATPLPVISSSVGAIGPVISPIDPTQGLGLGLNGRVDLGPEIVQDQIAIDNRRINLSPVVVPSRHLIPPEITVTPRVPIGRLRPTPATVLTTPGLGTVASSTNIQREEEDIALGGIPATTVNQLTPQQVHALQTIQAQQQLLNNQIQHVQQTGDLRNEAGVTSLGVTPSSLQINSQLALNPSLQNAAILRNEAGITSLGVTPSSLQINPQVALSPSLQNAAILRNEAGITSLGVTPSSLQINPSIALQNAGILRNEAGINLGVTPSTLQISPQVTQDQIAAFQNQQALINNQVQQAAGFARPDGRLLFTPNSQEPSLANVQQDNILAAELAKSGIDASQVQLTNIDLSSVTALPTGLPDAGLKGRVIINDGLSGAWGRPGRDTEKKKVAGKKAKGNN